MRYLDAIEEREEVLSYWKLSGEEPFTHPDYLAAIESGSSGIVVDDTGGTVIVLPIVRRELSLLDQTLVGMDCASPYGFGGPYGLHGPIGDEFLRKFAIWLREEGYASAFLRLDPRAQFAPMRAESTASVLDVSSNVIVDVSGDADSMWRSYDSKVRKNVKRARAMGCTVAEVDPVTHVDQFLAVYAETMTRRAAADFYKFGKEQLNPLLASADDISSMFFVMDARGEVVSVELVLKSATAMYSFLGGTLAEHFGLRPNDLLKHEIATAAHETGRTQFVLGGGYTRDDGIFKYKRAFAPNGVHPFLVARIVGDPELYRSALRARGCVADLDFDAPFFPQYREPVS